jgi:hypothetical protein
VAPIINQFLESWAEYLYLLVPPIQSSDILIIENE